MNSTRIDTDTNFGAGYNRFIANRAGLMIEHVHKAGALASEVLSATGEMTGRRGYETDAEYQLRRAETAIGLLLDDIRAARQRITALPAPSLEAAE